MNISPFFAKTKYFVFERPFTAFLSGAIILLVFFFVRQALAPKIEDAVSDQEVSAKQTAVFEIGKDTPTGTAIGTLDREHVSVIVASASGVISQISAREGSLVSARAQIARIAPSSASGARELAEAQLSTTEKNDALEREILDLNRKISEGETKSGRKEELARESKRLGNENLDLKLIASRLNLEIAKADESNFAPFAPFAGKIEALYVSIGDTVTPGMPIASIVGSTPHSIIRAEISSSIALLVDPRGTHRVSLPGRKTIPVTLMHISESALSADSFQATFSIPDADARLLGDDTILTLALSLKNPEDSAILVPLSAVQTTRDASTLLVNRNGIAQTVSVALGRVIGNFIEVTGELLQGDRIILDRSISSGDPIIESD